MILNIITIIIFPLITIVLTISFTIKRRLFARKEWERESDFSRYRARISPTSPGLVSPDIRCGMIIQLKQLLYKGDKSLLYIFVLFILVECAKIVISKCLGFAIIVGSVLGKIVDICTLL
jgi:hypothetical protein